MFSGIVESAGKIVALKKEKANLHISVSCPFVSELKADDSVAHNGVCLTVVDVRKDFYTVTAIDETLKKTNLGSMNKNDLVNLERSMKLGDRIDGHIVQGHVDATAACTAVKAKNGSPVFSFRVDEKKFPDGKFLVVEKGSVCVNGISLTIVDCADNDFSVAIIPYTLEHTNFKQVQKGSVVNIEFDILGKYILKMIR